MFVSLAIIVTLVSTGLISFFFIDSVADIWIVPVSLLGVYLLCTILFFLQLFIITRFVNMKKEYNKYNWFYNRFLVYGVHFLFSFANVKIKIKGLEKIPKDKKFLLISNHKSNFDPLLAIYALRKFPTAFISKPSNFKIPCIGKLMHRNGFISIDRENDREALKSILRGISHIKNDQFNIAVYPEGTRNKTEENLLPFKPGCLKIATKANVPIIVMTSHGSEKIHKRGPFRRTIVTFEILEILNPNDFESTNEISDYAYNLMNKNIIERKNGK